MSTSEEAGLISKAKDSFLQLLLDNRKSGDFTDFPITCDKSEWKVHRIVACSHSKYFRRMESFQEGQTKKIDMEGQTPAVIAKLVDYLYKCDYDDCVYHGDSSQVEHQTESEEHGDINTSHDEAASRNSRPSKLALHARMYVTGDMYCIDQLKLLAKAKFSAALVKDWDKEDLSDVIRFIYDNTRSDDREIRESLVPTLVRHKETLRSDNIFMNMVETHGEFAKDLINAWTDPTPEDSPKEFLQVRMGM
ncbi:MAG: hypothetical protein Q9198_002811 [Flavoplaca austrocitrina]